MSTIVNIHEAKTNLSALIRKVLAGEEVIIAKNHVPIVELRPVRKIPTKRVPGKLKGKMILLNDWDSADKEVEALIYSSKLFPDEDSAD